MLSLYLQVNCDEINSLYKQIGKCVNSEFKEGTQKKQIYYHLPSLTG